MATVVEKVTIIDQLGEVPSAVSRLRRQSAEVGDLAYDIESTGTDPLHSRIITIQLKPKGKKMVAIDVRRVTDDEEWELLGSMLEPLFDGSCTLVGHNLKFDLSFALAQMKLAAVQVYDTMLAEQVVLGMGVSSAAKRKIRFGLGYVAERYGLAVSKEERNWFIDLDQRPEEWQAPLPDEQVTYIRQDVSVVHRIKAEQHRFIEDYHLEEVINLEMRALLPLVGVEVFGVSINRAGWVGVLKRVEGLASGLEEMLHLGGTDEHGKRFEGLDVYVLKVRNEKYLDKWRPYQDWMKARDAFLETLRYNWDQTASQEMQDYGEGTKTYKNWSEYKKEFLDAWYEVHGKMPKPAASKQGVNLGSWMQVRDGFNALGIPVTGVSEEALTPYLGKHPLVKVYLDYAGARKLLTVYGEERGKKEQSFLEMLDEYDRLRASYQQIGADTGRMSSFRPNFQQIPGDGLGAELRHNVVAAPGYVLVDADFSNIELRIAAELSGDQFLLEAFASGQDLHAYTAVVMFGLKLPEGTNLKAWTESHDAVVGGRTLTKVSYRKVAKTINYMLLYGAGVRRLSTMLSVGEKDARALMAIYYETFAIVIAWLKKQQARLEQARKAGEQRVFSETRSGRRRWFDIPVHPAYPGSDGQRVSVEDITTYEQAVDEWKGTLASIKRQLGNSPVQGLSADITKEAAARWYEVAGYNPCMRLVAIIHDEFIIECTPASVAKAKALLQRVMTEAMQQYLQVVKTEGTIDPVETPYWFH